MQTDNRRLKLKNFFILSQIFSITILMVCVSGPDYCISTTTYSIEQHTNNDATNLIDSYNNNNNNVATLHTTNTNHSRGITSTNQLKRLHMHSRSHFTSSTLRLPDDPEMQLLMDTRDICKRTKRHRNINNNNKIQTDPYKLNSPLMERIIYGLKLATNECQYQFRNRRWNCTTVRRSLRKVLMRDTRETGFVNAIIAAGITFAVTRACTSGDLVECSCEKTAKLNSKRAGLRLTNIADVGHDGGVRVKGVSNGKQKHRTNNINLNNLPAGGDGEWEWGGCGDNINFGYKKSKECLDARHRKRSDIKTLMKLHNHEAGRLAIKNHMRTECKCHGLSGSCTLRTCWRKMPPFRDVGNRLKERFDGAAKVIAHNDGRKFMPEGVNIKPPGRIDLVYTDDSPDFCKPNRKTGSLGTQGRQCVYGSQSVDGCDLLCCGRGFTSRDRNETVNCRCRFKWCCEVTCDTCHVTRRLHTCN